MSTRGYNKHFYYTWILITEFFQIWGEYICCCFYLLKFATCFCKTILKLTEIRQLSHPQPLRITCNCCSYTFLFVQLFNTCPSRCQLERLRWRATAPGRPCTPRCRQLWRTTTTAASARTATCQSSAGSSRARWRRWHYTGDLTTRYPSPFSPIGHHWHCPPTVDGRGRTDVASQWFAF